MNDNNAYKTMFSCLGVILAVPILLVYGYLSNGIVLSSLWEWFVVPIFHINSITIVQAIGIAIVVGFLTHQTTNNSDKDEEQTDKWAKLIYGFISPWLTLLIAYIVHSFMN